MLSSHFDLFIFISIVQISLYLCSLFLSCYAFVDQLRTQALASLHSGLQNNQGLPIAHVAQWLAMEVPFSLLDENYFLKYFALEVPAHLTLVLW